MRRRALLSSLALSTTALAGCASQRDVTGTESETPTGSSERTESVRPDPEDPVLFFVRNGMSERQTVTVTLSRVGETLIDETVTLGPDESAEYDPRIETTGTYELAVAVSGGRSENWEWHLGSFAIRSGSNHFVEILPEELRFFYEE